MRISRFFASSILITFLCLLYVYQQTELVCLAYLCQKNESGLQDLVDKNNILRYNIKKNTSVISVARLASLAAADFSLPETYALVKMVPRQENMQVKERLPAMTLLSRFFGASRQAEAEALNPLDNPRTK